MSTPKTSLIVLIVVFLFMMLVSCRSRRAVLKEHVTLVDDTLQTWRSSKAQHIEAATGLTTLHDTTTFEWMLLPDSSSVVPLRIVHSMDMSQERTEGWRRDGTEESVITRDATLQQPVSEPPAQREQSEGKAPSRLRLFAIALIIGLTLGIFVTVRHMIRR